MRVGVFTGPISAIEGGGATLRSSITDVLRAGHQRHQFVVFQQTQNEISPRDHSPAVTWARNEIRASPRLRPIARAVKRSLDQIREESGEPSYEEKCLRGDEIDVAWFLSPYAKPV